MPLPTDEPQFTSMSSCKTAANFVADRQSSTLSYKMSANSGYMFLNVIPSHRSGTVHGQEECIKM